MIFRDETEYRETRGIAPFKLDSSLRYRVVAVEVECEACERGYRLNPDGLHYDDERGGRTWGVCRKRTTPEQYHWLDRATNQPLTYRDGSEARFDSLDEAITAFTAGKLSAERNEQLSYDGTPKNVIELAAEHWARQRFTK